MLVVGLRACLASFCVRETRRMCRQAPSGGGIAPRSAESVWGRCVVVALAAFRGSVVSCLARGRDGVGDAVVRIGDGGRDERPAVEFLLRGVVGLVVVVGGVVGCRVDARVP